MSSFYVENFGCRATQADGAAIEQQFRDQGLDRADAPARAAFQKLAQRLTDFDQGGTFKTAVYTPEAYRAVLLDAAGFEAPDVRKWPWPDLKISDFAMDADPNGLQFPHRTMTAAEIEKLDVKDFEGGFQGLVLKGPDNKQYTLSLRPLLPGDTEL